MSNDGGPAFPVGHYDIPNGGTHWPEHGMSLRDYMAVAALQGLLQTAPKSIDADKEVKILCASAYLLADAMIAARSEK